MSSRMRVVLEGRVQGVGFRYFTLQCARRLGVGGWVRNRADGAVELEAVARRELLDEFLRQVERGPRYSTVDRVARQELEVVEETVSEFEIRR